MSARAADRTSALGSKLRWLAGAWSGNYHWVPALLLLTFVSSAVTLVYPLVFGHVLDQVRGLGGATPAAELQATVRSLLGILLAIGLARFLVGFYPAFRALMNMKIEVATRRRYFAIVLGQGHGFFTRFRTGDIVTRLTDDISGYPKVAWFACSGLFRALNSSAQVACCLAAMFWLDASLALYSLIPVPLMIGLFVLLNHRLRAAVEDQRAAASETSDYLEAFFSGVSVVQAHNAQDRLGATLATHLSDRSDKEVRMAQLWVLFSVFFQALNVVGQLVVVLVGSLRVIDGTLSVGEFFSFYLYLGLLLAPLMDLPNLLVTGRQAFVCIDRLEELAEPDPEQPRRARGDRDLPRFERLDLAQVGYAYPLAEDAQSSAALHGIDLRLDAGQRAAVVGEIGAGKTTLLRVIMGILPSQQGAVTVNGRPLSDYAGPALRSAIGYVPQTPILFAESIRENILMGRDEDPARLARALDLANMTDEVGALDAGLDHVLGLRGSGLSGGQRQRLTIARALYGDPQLLLLDDITAALDAENEDRFWDRVDAAWPDATILVVTHRAATAGRMQRVHELVAGRLRDA